MRIKANLRAMAAAKREAVLHHLRFIGDLRRRLLILLLAVVVPAGLLTARAYFKLRDNELDRVQHVLSEHAARASGAMRVQVEVARHAIELVTASDWARSADLARCDQQSAQLIARSAAFSNVSIFDHSGQFLCGSGRPAAAPSVAGEPWFERVLRTREFTVSDLLPVARTTGVPAVVFAQPLAGPENSAPRVATVSMSAAQLRSVLESVALPAGAVMQLLDGEGRTVARVPEHAAWVGRAIGEGKVLSVVRRKVGYQALHDTNDWMHIVEAVNGKQPGLYVVLSAAEKAAVSLINRTFIENIVLFGLVALLAGLLVWFASERIIVRGVDEQLREGLLRTIAALASAVDARDPYTAGHQQRVSHLAVAIGRRLGLERDRLEGLRLGALVHDIGKLTIPTDLLLKRGALEGNERQRIEGHPRAGYNIVKDINFRWPVAEMVYQHHERLDGTGYPRGLKGEAIVLEARIIAVADAVEAITTRRPYREALGIEAALRHIEEHAGRWFDPMVVAVTVELFRDHDYELPSPQLREFPSLAAA
jgi:putative nucleotidyltransferase with HDIG domain